MPNRADAAVSTPPARAVTQRDVAREAGVHRATVSRALDPRRRELLDEATVARVADAAARLGYRPNALARGLKTNRSLAIGVVVPDVSSAAYAPLVAALEAALRDAGYTALVASTRDEHAAIAAVAERLAATRVDGIVLATGRAPGFALAALGRVAAPVVLVGGAPQADECASVAIDHRLGVEIAVGHLLRLGHTRIGLVAG